MWGDPHCDIPYRTLVNLMQHLDSIRDEVQCGTIIVIIPRPPVACGRDTVVIVLVSYLLMESL